MEKSKIIGKRIKEAREDKEYTLKELGNMISLSETTLSRYENGMVAKIKLPILESIANTLSVNIDWLLGISDVKEIDEKMIQTLSQTVPLIGQIACGIPILANENIEDYFSIDNRVKADFCLRAKGDSMIDEGIYPGDIVFIRKQDTLENGEIGAVIIENEATLKRFYKTDSQVILQPANNEYQPIVLDHGNVHIAGKLVAILNIRS